MFYRDALVTLDGTAFYSLLAWLVPSHHQHTLKERVCCTLPLHRCCYQEPTLSATTLVVMDYLLSIAAVVVLILLGRLLYIRRRSPEARRLPPGPSPIPIVGNVHQLPLECQEQTFFAWGKMYGMCARLLLTFPVIDMLLLR